MGGVDLDQPLEQGLHHLGVGRLFAVELHRCRKHSGTCLVAEGPVQGDLVGASDVVLAVRGPGEGGEALQQGHVRRGGEQPKQGIHGLCGLIEAVLLQVGQLAQLPGRGAAAGGRQSLEQHLSEGLPALGASVQFLK